MAKSVLLVVPAAEPAASLRDAAAFCGKIGAHLSVLAASFAPPLPLGEYGPAISGTWASERQSDLERLQKASEEITGLLAASDASCDVSGAYAEAGAMDEEISRRAMYTDLTLVNAARSADPIFCPRRPSRRLCLARATLSFSRLWARIPSGPPSG